ncbi:MAG: YceI family protein [Bryobacteraceae bacterium]
MNPTWQENTVATSPSAAKSALTYTIEPAHSSAHFKVRHLMISNVRGEFKKIGGTVVFDPQNPAASSVTVEIDVNSISTREPDRDAHLKSADFFDAAKYPVLRFQSKTVERSGPDQYKVTGDLTIRDVSREVVLKVEGPTEEIKDPWGSFRRGAEAATKVNRKDFGLTYNQVLEAGGAMIGDHVEIGLDVELVRKG